MLPSEDELTQETMEHWQKWLPRLAASLTRAGELEKWARNAARQTLEAVQHKVEQGMHPLEAYECHFACDTAPVVCSNGAPAICGNGAPLAGDDLAK